MGQREDGPLDPVIQFITFLEGIHEIITWFSSFCRRQKRVPYSFPSNTLTCSCGLPLLSHKPGDTCYAQGLLPTLPETLNARGVRRVPELPAFLVWTILSLLLTSNHMGLLAVLTGHVLFFGAWFFPWWMWLPGWGGPEVVNRHNTEDVNAKQILCMMQSWWIYVIIHLSKPKMNPNVNSVL